MKLIVNSTGRKSIKASELNVGQIAKIVDTMYTGHFIVATGTCLVSLTNPRCTWNTPCSIEVELLPVGYQITLEQTE